MTELTVNRYLFCPKNEKSAAKIMLFIKNEVFDFALCSKKVTYCVDLTWFNTIY